MLAFALGCPADVEVPQGIPSPTITPRTQVTEADPRVQRSGEDLYPTKTLERAGALQRREGSAGLGSGRPDESNGVCRLFAPKLPRPECCADNVGFDAPLVRTTCGLNAYLGESFDGTCGHYFAADDGKVTSFRLSRIAADSVQSAAQVHFRQAAMKRAPKPDDLGISGVLRSQYSGWNWAFIPGWDGAVRQLTWPDEACDDAGAKAIIQKLMAATKPAQGTPRPLVPQPTY